MLSIREIAEATGGEIASGGEVCVSGVSIDSRTIQPGELFIALKGDRFDGHDYVPDVLKICGGVLVGRSEFSAAAGGFSLKGVGIGGSVQGKAIVLVDDTLRALHNLARSIRKKFRGPVIGVIGSNGKTTTKELLAAILGTRMKVLKTTGNLNNHIGMPLSLARSDADVGAMVLEMGTNRPGDIKELCDIAPPDIGVITNIGFEHLEGFGSLDTVRDSELEILPYAKKLVLNADDAFLSEGVRERFQGEALSFGIESSHADMAAGDISLSDEGMHFSLCAGSERISIHSGLSGRFNIYNSLAAACAAYAVGFSLQEIKKGLESFRGVNMRFEVRKDKGVTYLNDSYNANPSSMEESVKELARRMQPAGGNGQKYKRAIAVLGDMLELGDYGITAHRKLGQWMSGLPVGVFIGVGPLMALAVSEFKGKGMHSGTSEDAGTALSSIVREGDIVLIKGSRGMKMEKALSAVFGKNPAAKEV